MGSVYATAEHTAISTGECTENCEHCLIS
jgi:hypothetical protein